MRRYRADVQIYFWAPGDPFDPNIILDQIVDKIASGDLDGDYYEITDCLRGDLEPEDEGPKYLGDRED